MSNGKVCYEPKIIEHRVMNRGEVEFEGSITFDGIRDESKGIFSKGVAHYMYIVLSPSCLKKLGKEGMNIVPEFLVPEEYAKTLKEYIGEVRIIARKIFMSSRYKALHVERVN